MKNLLANCHAKVPFTVPARKVEGLTGMALLFGKKPKNPI